MNQTRSFLLIAWLIVATAAVDGMEQGTRPPPLPAPRRHAATDVDRVAPAPCRRAATGAACRRAPRRRAPPARRAGHRALPQRTTGHRHQRLAAPDPRSAAACATRELLQYPRREEARQPERACCSTTTRRISTKRRAAGSAATRRRAEPCRCVSRRDGSAANFTLAAGAQSVSVPFVWTGAERRERPPHAHASRRGSYVLERARRGRQHRQRALAGLSSTAQLRARAAAAAQAQLDTNPEASASSARPGTAGKDKFEKRKFAKFVDDAPLDQGRHRRLDRACCSTTSSPPGSRARSDAATFSTAHAAGRRPGTASRELGPGVNVAPGAAAPRTAARLWVGPKLQTPIEAQHVPGPRRARVDYGSFTVMAMLAGSLFWRAVAAARADRQLGLVDHRPGGADQAAAVSGCRRSSTRAWRRCARVQPRIEALKERYGDDKQKLQVAHDGAVQEGKGQPGRRLPADAGADADLPRRCTGCCSETVELRQAPWIGWIQNLTAPDPYFVLPALNLAGDVADAEADADAGHGSDAAEDDAVHAAGVRRDDGLLPGRPGAVLGHQRRARPAAAVVDACAATASRSPPRRPPTVRRAPDGATRDPAMAATRHHRRHRHRAPAPPASASCACPARARARSPQALCAREAARRATRTTCTSSTPTATRIDDGIALYFRAPRFLHRRGRGRAAGARQPGAAARNCSRAAARSARARRARASSPNAPSSTASSTWRRPKRSPT